MKIFLIFFGVIFGNKLKFRENNVDGILSEDCQKDAYPTERVLYKPKGLVDTLVHAFKMSF